MKKNKNVQPTSYGLVLVLLALILLPTIVPFIHLLEEHEENTCRVKTAHFHEKELDCSICDFHLNKKYYSIEPTVAIEVLNFDELQISELYSFTYYHQQLSYSLRGPPSLL